jgi:hypothetical protein
VEWGELGIGHYLPGYLGWLGISVISVILYYGSPQDKPGRTAFIYGKRAIFGITGKNHEI